MLKFTLFLVLALPAAGYAQTPEQLVQDAQQKQRSGDLEGAVAEYKQFLQMYPEATAIHSNLGAALADLGRFEEAISEYKIALKQSPSLVQARLNLALCYYKMGRINDAAAELEKVHVEDPGNHQAALLLGDCYMRMDRENDVIRVLEPEEKKYPNDLGVAYLLGTALIRQKRVDEGQVLVDRILRNGDSAEAHLMLGTAKMGIQDFAGARDEFAKAVALNPNLPDAHVLYAKALMFTGDSDLSHKQFEAELRVDPYNFDANLQLGANARQEQNYEQARKYFVRAEETRPGDPGVRYQLALIDVDQGQLDQARQILEGLVKESPQFLEAHVTLSLVYYRLKRTEDSKREREIVQKLTAEAQAKQPGVNQSGGKVQ
ncbi:tetratricopeptide repeat protein [Alloacidobacterium sp.]|uniref:tetratricopeptide repeat protein n=1 Tax=Alloacidobacterium sp. TaxID=2951999 RepID=UPI002D3B2DA4|nr:tetratricopeptide repeat protein [Alloacidobacterium sp.]HYK37543.1 tetratricopeptide repeat protein [Alloacidobacterium sp.]